MDFRKIKTAALPLAGLALLAAALLLASGRRGRPAEEVQWLTMGTVAAFKCHDPADIHKAAIVRETFSEVERLLNAHSDASELRRLAALDDAEIVERCSPLVRPCYEAAFKFRDMSGGAFDPRWRGAGTMDLGGIAKGFALDLAARRLGECDALLDLGGNLKVCGGVWRVGIFGSGEIMTLTAGMSSSTSGEYFRGRHIKDARDGSDATGGVFSVTVVHPRCAMDADALSTILFIFGREQGAAFISSNAPDASVFWTPE